VEAAVAEDWSAADLDLLLRHAFTCLDESMRCHNAGAPHAALVSLASAFEVVLLGMVVACEDKLREADRFPPHPSRLSLGKLVSLARDVGWLKDEIADRVINVLNTARNMAAHPGAFVRGMRQVEDNDFDLADPVGYEAAYAIVTRACQEVFATFAVASDLITAPRRTDN
jgi:hypothetical protein